MAKTEIFKKFKDLGFNPNHRWTDNIMTFVMENQHLFDMSDKSTITLPVVKAVMSGLNINTVDSAIYDETEPKIKQPATEQPATEQPATEQAVTEQVVTEQPATEQAVTEQAVTEQNVTEQPSGFKSRIDKMRNNLFNAINDSKHDTIITANATGEPLPKERKKRVPKQAETPPPANLVTGYMLLVMIDLVIPNGITYFHNRFTRKGKENPMSVSVIKLTPAEIKELLPLADEAAKSLTVSINPITFFIISYGLITFTKYQFKV